MGSSLRHATVLSHGESTVRRYVRSQAGEVVGRGPWRQTDLGLNPPPSTYCSLASKSRILILPSCKGGVIIHHGAVQRVNAGHLCIVPDMGLVFGKESLSSSTLALWPASVVSEQHGAGP